MIYHAIKDLQDFSTNNLNGGLLSAECVRIVIVRLATNVEAGGLYDMTHESWFHGRPNRWKVATPRPLASSSSSSSS